MLSLSHKQFSTSFKDLCVLCLLIITEGSQESELECSICLSPAVHPVQLPCSHIFCFLCVKGSANRSKRCALCRQVIPPQYLYKPTLLKTDDLSHNTSFVDEYKWYYEGNRGWWQYDERTSSELEVQYKAKCDKLEVLIAGFLYVVDFENMIQYRRNDPSRRRRIKRDTGNIPIKGVAGLKISLSETLVNNRREGDGGFVEDTNQNQPTNTSGMVQCQTANTPNRSQNQSINTPRRIQNQPANTPGRVQSDTRHTPSRTQMQSPHRNVHNRVQNQPTAVPSAVQISRSLPGSQTNEQLNNTDAVGRTGGSGHNAERVPSSQLDDQHDVVEQGSLNGSESPTRNAIDEHQDETRTDINRNRNVNVHSEDMSSEGDIDGSVQNLGDQMLSQRQTGSDSMNGASHRNSEIPEQKENRSGIIGTVRTETNQLPEDVDTDEGEGVSTAMRNMSLNGRTVVSRNTEQHRMQLRPRSNAQFIKR